MHWADELPVTSETDVQCIWLDGCLVKIALIEFNGESRCRVTVGNPLGSMSAHFDCVPNALKAVEKFTYYSSGLKDQLQKFNACGKSEARRKHAPVTSIQRHMLEGCLLVEPRGFPTWGTDVIPSEQWIDPHLTYETRDGKKILNLNVCLANSGGNHSEVTFPVKCSIYRGPGKQPEYAIYTLTGRHDLFNESSRDLVLIDDEKLQKRGNRLPYPAWFKQLSKQFEKITGQDWAGLSGDNLEPKQWYIDHDRTIPEIVNDFVEKYDLTVI